MSRTSAELISSQAVEPVSMTGAATAAGAVVGCAEATEEKAVKSRAALAQIEVRVLHNIGSGPFNDSRRRNRG
jgi:hypothetical protein